jgi:uncharacterized integral membrane protein
MDPFSFFAQAASSQPFFSTLQRRSIIFSMLTSRLVSVILVALFAIVNVAALPVPEPNERCCRQFGF